MSSGGFDADAFAMLIRRVVDARSVAILDRSGATVFSAGEPADISDVAAGLWQLETGVTHVHRAFAHLGDDEGLTADWLIVEHIGPRARQLAVIIGTGDEPEGEAATALDIVLSGARERHDLLGEIDEMEQVLRQQVDKALLSCITRAQSDFILDGDAREVFTRLLDDVLTLTESEYGFIGEVETDADGERFLRTWAITNIAWTDELSAWYEQNSPTGIEFTNLDTLFGAVIRTGEPVVANSPTTDARRGGLPEGHPSLDAFLGLPFVRGDELLGMIGLANRPGGYDKELIDQLEAFLTTCSTLVEALRGRRQRTAAEDLVRASEARTRAILESVVDAVVVIDELGRIETFNAAAEQTFGYSYDEVIGRNVSMLMTDGDAAAHDGHLRRFRRAGEGRVIVGRREVVGRRRDGSTFPLELSVSEFEVADGRLFAGTCRDLTDKQRADREIQMYAATIEATPDFVGVARVGGEVLAVNRAGRALVGLDPDAPAVDIEIGDIHVPWSRELVRTIGLPAAIRDGMWSGETAFVAPDGREIPMSQVIVVSRDDDGEPQLVSTIARDISDLKEVERVKSEFVSTVSHELRTPLTSIRGSLGLIAGGVLGELPPQADELISLARANTDRLIRLVNDILDFEKAQSGRVDVQLRELIPLDVALTAVDTVRGAATEAGVTVRLDVPDRPLPSIIGDDDRLVQVLVNLIGNAVKFSESGTEVTLSIDMQRASTVDFVVTDQGPGISADELETIFEPFHQVDSSDRRAVGGTGLGLAIARAITEAHGGVIRAESTLGIGSTFVVSLPRATSETPRGLDLPTSDAARPDVLIVERDPSNRRVVRQILEGQGLRCAEVGDGELAVELVDVLDPRLLLIDVELPRLDAFAVSDCLRQRGHGDLPLVVYTGRDLRPGERARLRLGHTRHLVKSLASETDLVDAVRELLDIDRVAPAP